MLLGLAPLIVLWLPHMCVYMHPYLHTSTCAHTNAFKKDSTLKRTLWHPRSSAISCSVCSPGKISTIRTVTGQIWFGLFLPWHECSYTLTYASMKLWRFFPSVFAGILWWWWALLLQCAHSHSSPGADINSVPVWVSMCVASSGFELSEMLPLCTSLFLP